MSNDFSIGENDKLVRLLSSERLARFAALVGTERDGIELHRLSMEIAGALMPVIGTIEIALRNAIANRLKLMFGTANWLTVPPVPFRWKSEEKESIDKAVRHAQRVAYAKMNSVEKSSLDRIAFPSGIPPGTSHERHSKERQNAIRVESGQIIAQLTMYFWKKLISDDYEQTLWKRSLKNLFPNKSIKRGEIARHLEKIYQVRNRIAHHEPVYGHRLFDFIESVEFVCRNFESRHPHDSSILMRMTADHRKRLAETAHAFEAAVQMLRAQNGLDKPLQ
jgi:hypothetical protein